jgi:hypothetical protein
VQSVLLRKKMSESLADLKTTNIKIYWRTVKQLLNNFPICAQENDTVYKFEDKKKCTTIKRLFLLH